MNTLITGLGVALLAQAENAAGPNPADVQIQSIWDFIVKGGWMMVPIGLCSLVALTVTIERFISLARGRVIPSGFLPGLRDVLRRKSRDRRAALEYCRENGSPVAHVFAAGIKRMNEPVERLEKHIEEAGEREVFKLRKYLRVLSVIASISPLMGLLGTIFGMIRAFQTVATSGEALGQTELLARGIYEAMITTAAGLLVAIPVLIAHHFFVARIEHLVAEIDQMTVDFVEELTGVTPSPAVSATDTEPARGTAAGARDAADSTPDAAVAPAS